MPGNGGTAGFDRISNIDAKADHCPGLVDLVKDLKVNLVPLGSDVNLGDSIEPNVMVQIQCFGPSRETVPIEGP